MLSLTVAVMAQRPQRVVSPQVNPDNTVTFRVQAPNADSVKLEGWDLFTYLGKRNRQVNDCHKSRFKFLNFLPFSITKSIFFLMGIFVFFTAE